MKYCIAYDNKSRHLNDFNEIILKYDHKTSAIIEHVQKYKQEQRIILNIQELEDVLSCKDIFNAAADEHSSIAIMGTITQTAAMKEIGLPWFYADIVDSWDMLNGFIKQGVSDVYVGNEFAFDMFTISSICKEANVNVRVFANVAQTNCPMVKNTMTQFFIRPEDVPYYESYVDVIEFYGPLDRQDILYDIYSKGKWLGNLNDLIIGLEEKINNTVITGCFGVLRVGCKKRCGYSNKCDVCTRFLNIDKVIEEVYNERKTNEISM